MNKLYVWINYNKNFLVSLCASVIDVKLTSGDRRVLLTKTIGTLSVLPIFIILLVSSSDLQKAENKLKG